MRLGAEKVYVIYRRSMDELPARAEEVENAQEELIEFKTLTNPVRILGDEDHNVCGIECVDMELGEPDETWGWILKQGAALIQTDRPQALINYLKKHKRH